MTDLLVDMRDLDSLVDDLRTFASRALPFAARNSLNTSAFRGRRIWVNRIEKDFITRNKFTAKSVRVEKARGLRIDSMDAVLGSVAPYMRIQELGGTERGSGSSKPIPTSVAAGQAMGTSPRTRQVRRPNRQQAIRLQKASSKGRTRAQRNAMGISKAVSSGRKFFLLETDRGKGIARVTGRKRLTVRLIWDLSRPSVRIPRTPTLQRSLDALDAELPAIHREAVLEQLRRNKVLGF